MKVLLSNKYYYPRGGSDIYMIELEKLLKKNGHEVAVFSMQHSLNLQAETSKFFPEEVDMNGKNVKDLIPALLRPFGVAEVRKKFIGLINEFKPDIVHLNNIHSQLSPLLGVLASHRNIPVIWTLHDHKLLCSRYDCMRNNKPCELCFTNNFNVVRYRCMKNSLMASIVAYAEALVWNREKMSEITNTFICPSNFLLSNMVKGGFKREQLSVLPNFIDDKRFIDTPLARENHYCYVGRLSAEKGVETLLKAAADLHQFRLKVVGTGPLEERLRAKYNKENIEFLGFQKWDELKLILGSAVCMVIPSECYENNPLSVIESLCLGTPVIGARIGGIPELIDPGRNGLVFESGNMIDLQKKIKELYLSAADYKHDDIALEAREKFDSNNFYNRLSEIYSNLVFNKY
ncbi:MAG: glycosyltransferase [Bacteroidota bacterium]|nr:glycosyltransferase [Bacteroidota bacterium]